MPRFTLITDSYKIPEVRAQARAINDGYFTIDTADRALIDQWNLFNPYTVTHALLNNQVEGFVTVIPIKSEAGALMEECRLKEDDLTIEHILPPQSMPVARYAYIAAIAIRNRRSYQSRCCAAALIKAAADKIITCYSRDHFKTLFANPTTFDGNHMVTKFGFAPQTTFKKALRENDIYSIQMNDQNWNALQNLSTHYDRFVDQNCWRDSQKNWGDKLRGFKSEN